MGAAFQIQKSLADGLDFDLATAVTAYQAACEAHATTIDQPAPSAHPIVEEIVRRHGGAFAIIDDNTPADRRYNLTRSVLIETQERVNRVLSPARQNLAMLDAQILSQKEVRTPTEEQTLSEALANLAAIAEIQRHAAFLTVEIDETPETLLADWRASWPAA
jgi:hypothetical protein